MVVEKLTAAGASSVEIHHHGAHITSWKNSAGREVIYTSSQAVYDGKKAIRGGIPICFPQFGKKGPLRQHGFARNTAWKLDRSYEKSEDKVSSLRFVLESDEDTLASEWNFAFKAAYVVTLSDDGDSLSIDFRVTNKDERTMTFTTALHSYYACDPENATIPELTGVQYTDSIDPDAGGPKIQEGPVKFGKEVDRVYVNTADILSIPSVGLTIRKTNMPEAVVWNPHIERSAGMGDLPNDGWRSFICVEPARIQDPAVVEPGQTWSSKLVLECPSSS